MHSVRSFAAAWLMLGPALALAQASAPAAPPPQTTDPLAVLDPKASVPALPQIAAFEGYHAYQAQAVAPWRQSNAAVSPQPKPPTAAERAGKPEAAAGHAHHNH
jgi:hypothetical protein